MEFWDIVKYVAVFVITSIIMGFGIVFWLRIVGA